MTENPKNDPARGIPSWANVIAPLLLFALVLAATGIAPLSAHAFEQTGTAGPGRSALAAGRLSAQAGSDISTATPIALNATASGSMSKAYEKHWYKLTLPSNGKFQVKMLSDYAKSGSWKVALFTQSNVEIWSDYYHASNTVQQTIHTTGLPAGTFYIYVECSNSSVTNHTYRLTPTFTSSTAWEREKNDTIVTGNPIDLNAVVHGTSSKVYDTDWYRITLPSDGRLEMRLSGEYSSSGSWKTALYTASNVEMWSDTYSASNTEEKAVLVTGLPAGTYYFYVEGLSSNLANLIYNLTPKFTANPSWERERNNTIATANPIAFGEAVQGTSCKIYDEDWYKITVPAKIKLALTFQGPYRTSGSWKVSLYTSGNSRIWSDSYRATSRKSLDMFCGTVAKGTYYICIEGLSSNLDSLAYSLTPACFVDAPAIKKATSAKRAFTVKWKKVSGATSYQVRYSLKKSMKGSSQVNIAKKATSKKIKKLAKKKKYWVQVRAAKTLGGKTYYSAWSGKKAARTR